MATVYNQILNDEEESGQQPAQSAPEAPKPIPSTGSSSTLGSSGGSTAASTQKQASGTPSRSGQFTNIQNYLQANTQGSKQLGQGVAQKVGAKVASGLGEVDKSKTESVQGVQTLGQQGQQIQQQGKAAVENIFTGQNAPDLAVAEGEARKGLSDQYAQDVQKTQFSNLQNLVNKQEELGQLGKQTRTGSGQQAILQRTYARPDYTAGQSRLDSMLLGGSKEGQQGLSKARQQVGQYNPLLQKAVGEFDQQKEQQTQQLNQGMEGLKTRIAEATNQGLDATADKSLYAQLKGQADQLNAQRSAQTAKLTNNDILKALNQTPGMADSRIYDSMDQMKKAGDKKGFDSLDNKIKIPGTSITVKVSDLAKNPQFFKEVFQNAEVSNVNTEALNRLNTLNRLGNVGEIQAGKTLNTGIDRSMSGEGSQALKSVKSALQAQGISKINQPAVNASSRFDTEQLQSLTKPGAYANRGSRVGNAINLVQGYIKEDPRAILDAFKNSEQNKTTTRLLFDAPARALNEDNIGDYMAKSLASRQLSSLTTLDAVRSPSWENSTRKYIDQYNNALKNAPNIMENGKKFGNDPINPDQYISDIRNGKRQLEVNVPTGEMFARKSFDGIVSNLAQNSLKAQQQQTAVQNILSKYLGGKK